MKIDPFTAGVVRYYLTGAVHQVVVERPDLVPTEQSAMAIRLDFALSKSSDGFFVMANRGELSRESTYLVFKMFTRGQPTGRVAQWRCSRTSLASSSRERNRGAPAKVAKLVEPRATLHGRYEARACWRD